MVAYLLTYVAASYAAMLGLGRYVNGTWWPRSEDK